MSYLVKKESVDPEYIGKTRELTMDRDGMFYAETKTPHSFTKRAEALTYIKRVHRKTPGLFIQGPKGARYEVDIILNVIKHRITGGPRI